MYVPLHFAAPADALTALVRTAPFADLVTAGPDGLISTPLPWLFEGGSLLGHVARNNPHWRAAGGPQESLVIFRGPDAYVSPTWYEDHGSSREHSSNRAEHGRVVPTWNYVTAHVYGRLIAHDDVEWTSSLVRRLTDRFEATQPAPWSMDDAPGPFIAGHVRAIVGVELLVNRVEAKYKLSQNRSAADVEGVIAALSAGSSVEQSVAEAMRAAAG